LLDPALIAGRTTVTPRDLSKLGQRPVEHDPLARHPRRTAARVDERHLSRRRGPDGGHGGEPVGDHGQGALRCRGILFQQDFEAAARDVLRYRDVRRIQRPGPVREQNLRAADTRRCHAVRRSLEQGEPGRVRERIGRIVGALGKHALPVVLGIVPDIGERRAAVIHRQAVGAFLRTVGKPLYPEQGPVPAENRSDHRAHALDIREPPFVGHGCPSL
jgi:hypothetical protein